MTSGTLRRPGSFSSRLNKPPSRPRGRKPATSSERRSYSPLQESKTPRIQSDVYSTVCFQKQFERLATLCDWHPESPIPRRDLRRQTNQRRGGRVTPPRAAIQRRGGWSQLQGWFHPGSSPPPRLRAGKPRGPRSTTVVFKASAVRLITHLKQRATTPLSAVSLKPLASAPFFRPYLILILVFSSSNVTCSRDFHSISSTLCEPYQPDPSLRFLR